MPLIRYTYPPDVRVHGDRPVLVEELQARVVCDDMRRAVRVGEDELAELKKDELVDLAEQVDVDVPKRNTKGQFVKKIVEAEGQ